MRNSAENEALIREALDDHALDYEELGAMARVVEHIRDPYSRPRVRRLLLQAGKPDPPPTPGRGI